ncbi:MAG: acyltransferase [Eubacteriales bacterium]|nr:acyltransferase [Eubacteriales bacterium]
MAQTDGLTDKRAPYLDFLRIAAAFLVIVTHTNSLVFKALTPANGTWHLSVLWYYISKPAVPLFVMVSGACLLNKIDSYPKIARRFGRVLLAALAASYAYFLYDAWVYYGLWPRMADFGAFLAKVWQGEITDGFWYLAFYLGLMLTLPFWQRMAAQMQRTDYRYLMIVTFGVGAVWPLLAHYIPDAKLPEYFDLPMLSVYVGLLFAGQYIHRYGKADGKTAALSATVLVGCMALCLWLTRLEFDRMDGLGAYWFMDDRAHPALLVALAAMALMSLAKVCLRRVGSRSAKVWQTLGGCAFAIYLMQDLAIAQTKQRLFLPLCDRLPSLAAALIWEIAVFALCLALAYGLKKIPCLRKLL